MIFLRSRLTLDGITSSTGYRSVPQSIASAIPVLPEVESRITLPGLSLPSAIPASSMLFAGRSLIEPPGLKPSSLAKIRTPGFSNPAVSRLISSSGVLPIRSSTLRARPTGTTSRPSAKCGLRLASAGDRGNDSDVVAILDLGVNRVEKADVVAVEIDIHEAPHVAFFIYHPL